MLFLALQCHSVCAQQVTINLSQGWNWIAYTCTEPKTINEALGSFEPIEGDVIKDMSGSSIFLNGQWQGSLNYMIPGRGYMYYYHGSTPTSFSFSEPVPQLIVTTSTPSEITAVSATCGGNVTSGNGDYVSVSIRGFCWGEQPDPTINDHYIELESGGIGEFSETITGLEINTTYYVRAFAVTNGETYFGEQQSFTTKNGIPILTTAEVTDIESIWALGGGTMLDDGGLSIDELGICWGTSPNPTFEGSHAISNVNSGSFTVEMTNLTPNTTYYVRTYATNSHTTAYGNEITFVTAPAPTWPNGILPGLFSVSATKQVQFSQGNLQYKASSNVWRFADNQYDFVGEANANISETYDGWIDLFGWGTSGYNHGAVCYQPWSTSISDYDYFAYGQWNADLCDQSGMADWGYNAISNGGNQENLWRTMT